MKFTKEWMREYNKAYKAKHKAEIQRYAKEYHKLHYIPHPRPRFIKKVPQPCHAMRKTKYGITPEQYAELLISQNGVCAICGNPETSVLHKTTGKLRSLGVDHNHVTGKVRGLLCTKCNQGIGGLKTDTEGIELLASAISYIRNSENIL